MYGCISSNDTNGKTVIYSLDCAVRGGDDDEDDVDSTIAAKNISTWRYHIKMDLPFCYYCYYIS